MCADVLVVLVGARKKMAASLCKVRFFSVPSKAKTTGSVLLLSAQRIRWSQQVHLCGHSKGSPGLQARVRAIPLLIATGSGYFGYNRYERYKDRELEKLGIEVPPRVASEIQVVVLKDHMESVPPLRMSEYFMKHEANWSWYISRCIRILTWLASSQ